MRWLRALHVLLLGLLPLISTAQPSGGTAVTFDTVDREGRLLTLRGVLYAPAGAPKSAVVLIHSSGGWQDAREGHYGRSLSAAGHLVLAVDSFGPRGIVKTTDDQSQAGSFEMALDALAARRYLAGVYKNIGTFVVMGFSKGGLAALFTADRTFHPGETDRFTAAIAFYPSCAFRARSPKPATPVLMLLAGRDDYSGVKPCQDWADAFGTAGGRIETKVYDNAQHSFDGSPAAPAPIYLPSIENFSRCLVLVEDDGQWHYQGRLYPTQLSTHANLVRSCVSRGGTVGTDRRSKEQATADVLAHLDRLASR